MTPRLRVINLKLDTDVKASRLTGISNNGHQEFPPLILRLISVAIGMLCPSCGALVISICQL